MENQGLWCGKTSPEHSPATREKTSDAYSQKLSGLQKTEFLFLDLRAGDGSQPEASWGMATAWPGASWMPNTGECPSEGKESTLLQILEDGPQEKYYLSEKACAGILRRAQKRGKNLPEKLKTALERQAGGAVRPKTLRIRCGCAGGGKGPLVQEDKSATLSCHNDQTVFVPAERRVVALENHSQDSRVDVAKDNIRTTLTGKMGTGGNNVPLLMESRSTAYGICSMDSNAMKSENPDSGFYEAQTSRTIDCRGGNPACNQGGIVIVGEKHPVYSIGRDCVTVHEDRAQTLTAELLPGSVAQPYSVGNGQTHSLSLDEKAGTLNCIHDQQAVMVPKAVDASHADDVVRISDTASVQARDYKGGKYVFAEYIVRRFTPLECGRLQGFPDDWTDGLSDEAPDKKTVQFWLDAWMEWWALVGRAKGIKRPKDEKAVRRWLKDPASDTEIYKMWGNGIALPCAQYVFEGIAAVLGVTESDTQKGDDGIG